MMKKTNKIINTILYVILSIILIANLFVLYQAKANNNEVPAIFGYKPFIVMSGSMEDTICTKDLIFIKKIDPKELKENDIIAFRTEDNIVVTHRIIEIKDYNGDIRYKTKGDNNPTEDLERVSPDAVEGIYVKRIPKLGSWFLFISTTTGMIVSVLIAVIIIMVYAFINMNLDNKEKKEEEEKYRKEFEEFKKNNPHK